MSKRGRPTEYNPEIAQRICDLICTSTKSIRRLCDENEDLPHATTVWRWVGQFPDFCDQYVQAKKAQQEIIADECIDIADASSTKEHAIINRVRIEARQWNIERLAPKRDLDRTPGLTHLSDAELAKLAAPVLQQLIVNQHINVTQLLPDKEKEAA